MHGTMNPQSDYDVRGVFVNNSLPHLVGFHKKEFFQRKDDDEGLDVHLWEWKRFVLGLYRCDVQAVETLFNNRWIYIHPFFKNEVIDCWYKLINPDKLISSLKGFLFNETNVAFGLGSGGKLGARKKQIEEIGYSSKNAAHALRLAFSLRHFLIYGRLISDFREFPFYLDLIKKMKSGSQRKNWVKKLLTDVMDDVKLLHGEKNEVRCSFDTEFAARLCLKGYATIFPKH